MVNIFKVFQCRISKKTKNKVLYASNSHIQYSKIIVTGRTFSAALSINCSLWIKIPLKFEI